MSAGPPSGIYTVVRRHVQTFQNMLEKHNTLRKGHEVPRRTGRKTKPGLWLKPESGFSLRASRAFLGVLCVTGLRL
jgi:hypothetical protein